MIQSPLAYSFAKGEIRRTNVDFMLSTNGSWSWRQLHWARILNCRPLLQLGMPTKEILIGSTYVTWGWHIFYVRMIIFDIKPCWRCMRAIKAAMVIVVQEVYRGHAMCRSCWPTWKGCSTLRMMAMLSVLFGCAVPTFQCCCHFIIKNGGFHGRSHL